MDLLNVDKLTIQYSTDDGIVEAVRGISFQVNKGECLGLVGETGAGKTTTALGIMKLIASPPGRILSGSVIFEGSDILQETEEYMRHIRGGKISMIFQDPMTSLNPVLTIGDQIAEAIILHQKVSTAEALRRSGQILEMVGIPADRINEYPHQFSGGMRQRVVIAIALSCNPSLLIADEPTTALDVTIQAQVLEMIRVLREERGTSMLLITHDLGVVAEICDRVAVIYAGEIVEMGSLADIFTNTAHPYTVGLFNSLPRLDIEVERLQPIKGLMPDPTNLPVGCAFSPRCPYKFNICERENPGVYEITAGHSVKCHLLRSKNDG